MACAALAGAVFGIPTVHHLRTNDLGSLQSDTLRRLGSLQSDDYLGGKTSPELRLEREGATERTITVESQHANCPDAQCPRARIYNVGYIAQGYNLIYGNPFPTSGGIDPGFKDYGGSRIFQVTYEKGRETIDGRQEAPDDIAVMAEHARGSELAPPSASMSVEEASSTTDYQLMVQSSDAYEGDVGIKGFSATAKASRETMAAEQTITEDNVVVTYSTAMCDAFRVTMNKYSGRPKFSDVFAKAALEVKNATGAKRKAKFYDLFDLFGTHYVQSLTLGSKFSLVQTFKTSVWAELKETSQAHSMAAEVGLEMDLKKKKKAKKKKKSKKGCDTAEPTEKKKDKREEKDPCVQSTMDWIKEAWGLMLYKIGTIEAKVGIESESEETSSQSDEFKDESFSREIVSIGAPPSEDPVEWAQQTHDEAMPIKYNLMPLCHILHAEEPKLLSSQKQAKQMLGGITPKESLKLVSDCEDALYKGYCNDRVAPRSGIECETKLAGRKQHICKVDQDCNAPGDKRVYECVQGVCKIPYMRIVDMKLVGASTLKDMPSCPDGYEAVTKGKEGEKGPPAQIGCPDGDPSCSTFAHLCVLRKDSRVDATSKAVCQAVLTGTPQLRGQHCLTDECTAVSNDPGRVTPDTETKRLWDQCKKDNEACLVGSRSKESLQLVTFDDCVDCPEGREAMAGSVTEKFLFIEKGTCEQYVEYSKDSGSQCVEAIAYDTCDLSHPDHTMDLLGVKYPCDQGANLIPPTLSAYCRCKAPIDAIDVDKVAFYHPEGGVVYNTDRFFCGHEPFSCGDICASRRIRPGITHILAADDACPSGYSEIAMNYKDMPSNLFDETVGAGSGGDSNTATSAPVLVLCASYAYEIGGEGGTTVADLERDTTPPHRHPRGGALAETVVERFVQRGAPTTVLRRKALAQQARDDAGPEAELKELNELAGVISRIIDPVPASFLEKDSFVRSSPPQQGPPGARVGAIGGARGALAMLGKAGRSAAAGRLERKPVKAEQDTQLGGPGPDAAANVEKVQQGGAKDRTGSDAAAAFDADGLVAVDTALGGELFDASREDDGEMERAGDGIADAAVATSLASGAAAGDAKIIVRSQSAICPDAQCPRAKVVNLGYIAKGYNLIYANPHPKKSGVDPGFTTFGGADIFQLTYADECEEGDPPPCKKETPDGRYEIPNALDVNSEFACVRWCSLSFKSTTASSSAEYQSMERDSTSISASMSVGPFFSSSFKASKERQPEFQKNEESMRSGEKTAVSSQARCTAYSARYASAKPQEIAEFTEDFSKAVNYLIATEGFGPNAKKDVEDEVRGMAWYDFFDTFGTPAGTHFFSLMQLGSRYSMQQIFDKTAYDGLTTTAEKSSISADVSMGIGYFSSKAGYEGEQATDKAMSAAGSESKEDRFITSLGAPPAEDELSWAQQSAEEAMPIDMVPVDLCSLFEVSDEWVAAAKKDTKLTNAAMLTAASDADLFGKCKARLSINGYCQKRVGPRSGVSVCTSIRSARKVHRCSKDADCGVSKGGGASFECVRNTCILAYTRVYDMHLAFQTPCPSKASDIAKDKPKTPKPATVECDGEPVCEPGYEKVVKVPPTGAPWTPGGKGLGVANLNEFKAELPEETQADTYTIHLCIRKVSTTRGGGGPIRAESLQSLHYDEYEKNYRTSGALGRPDANYGKWAFPVCSAFLSKATDAWGKAMNVYYEESKGQGCRTMREKGLACDYALGEALSPRSELRTSNSDKLLNSPETMDYLARVQGTVGCVQRAPGPANQKYLTRGLLSYAQLEDKRNRGSLYGKAYNELTAHRMFSNMGGASNVNMQSAKCYEQNANVFKERYEPYKPKEIRDASGTAIGYERVPYNAKGKKIVWQHGKTKGRDYGDGGLVSILNESYTTQTEVKHMEAQCGKEPGWEGRTEGRRFYFDGMYANVEKRCDQTAVPKFLWFQSQSCEKVSEPLKCKSFTRVDCNNHAKVIEERLCDDSNDVGAVGANEAGYCTCLQPVDACPAGTTCPPAPIYQPAYFMCGQHPATSCQDYCQAKNPIPAITDIVMVSSADLKGKGKVKCPAGYELVDSIGKGMPGITPIDANLNEGRDEAHWPQLHLCQTRALTSK